MKKFTKLISLLCLAAVFVLASCSSPSSGGGGGRAQVSGKIGKYDAPYVVGDIVFKDGSATPYADFLGADETAGTEDDTITDEQKAAAIAVIFYVGTGLNSDDDNGNPDNTTRRTLGVGLKHNRNGLAWCDSTSVKGYSKDITKIQCIPTGSGETLTLTFSGDKNGSDNLEQISDFLEDEDDDTNNLDNYPAFKFGKEYSTEATEGTDYDESGWYLPSLAELHAIYNVKTTVDEASSLCGGSQFGSGFYWSSSQSAYGRDYAYYFGFVNGGCNDGDKYGYANVCAVRAFN